MIDLGAATGLLDLPPGFAYDVVSQTGHPLTGAVTFPGKWGRTYLVRSHERGVDHDAAAELTYDPGAAGGTTTLLVDRCNEVLSGHVSLAGTCALGAGGATPWGTWLTGEVTEQKAGGALTRDHGYVFEVSLYHPEANRAPEPLAALGRFAHAAVVADPVRGHLYLTEDASSPDGLLYRCTPRTRRNGLHTLRRGGMLEALAVPGVPDLSAGHRLGTELLAAWKPVPDPSAATAATREQFADGDVTRIPGRTDAWWRDGRLHIACPGAGQVWSYDPKRQRLRLDAFLPEDTGPDSITVDPWGGLIIAEHHEGVRHLVALRGGRRAPLARNTASGGELTGITFSPDRRTLFVNIRDEGATCAIRGPFAQLGS